MAADDLVPPSNAVPATAAATAGGDRRDIEAAAQVGRFKVADVDLALSIAAGSALALGQLLHEQPARDDAEAADRVTVALLRTFGLTPREARRIGSLPLPGA